jgi:ATP-dependent RNA helicase RhlE
MLFNELGLEPELLRAVADKGYATATPIQAKAIPAILSGKDVLAGAQTGTGKTAGFVLPLLQTLGNAQGQRPRVLVLVPTRELAAQVAQSVRDYGAHKRLRTIVIFGGVSEKPQIDELRVGCDILIATPGRLLDLCERGLASLNDIKHLVLDEADRMLDMGFIHAIKRIVKMLPTERQNLMFSATYSENIRKLAARMLRHPVEIEVAPRNSTAERVAQYAFRIAKDQKRHLLVHLFNHGIENQGRWHQALVFTRTKHGANKLAAQLEACGIDSAVIHGNKSQSARVKALEDFKAGRVTALVATEVASRGLDIKELPHVVNYELPNVPEDYVHRIGRTARAGSTGAAVSLVAPDEAPLLRDIERTMNHSIAFGPLPEYQAIHLPAGAAQVERFVDPRAKPREPRVNDSRPHAPQNHHGRGGAPRPNKSGKPGHHAGGGRRRFNGPSHRGAARGVVR